MLPVLTNSQERRLSPKAVEGRPYHFEDHALMWPYRFHCKEVVIMLFRKRRDRSVTTNHDVK